MAIILRKADLVEMFVHIRGKPINLQDYTLFRPFYNSKAPRKMTKAGRQIGKSTALAADQCYLACRKNRRILTVHPLSSQSQRFSQLYVNPILQYSPTMKRKLSTKLSFKVSLKELLGGGELHYNYSGDDPDRIRGISVQDICWDEIQDINIEHIPVVEQCAGQEIDPHFVYCGTPKTKNNTMEVLWLKSSQSEPFITCSKCRHENFCIIPDVYEMVKKEGLVCQKCHRLIDVEDIRSLRYEHFNPQKVGEFDGFHMPQIFVPYNVMYAKRWKKIYQDFHEYSPFLFATEVLGISYDLGGNPVTLEHLIKCCNPDKRLGGQVDLKQYTMTIGGVDWGISGKSSSTVLTILGVRKDGKIELIYAKKFPYTDPEAQTKNIEQLCMQYNCRAIGLDFGVGYAQNMRLRYNMGPDRIYEYQYSNAQKVLKYLEEQARFSVNKVQTMDLMFRDLRKKFVQFPHRDDMMPFFEEVLSISEEMRPSSGGDKRYYVKSAGSTDDFVHALNFALITVRLLTKGTVISNIIED